MSELLEQSPLDFANALRSAGLRRACVTLDGGAPRPSHPIVESLAQWLAQDTRDFAGHEGMFFEVGAETGALFGAFVHWTHRGQGQGGLRHWAYPTFESFVRDGLRLARGMTRKNALADLWWGGGKGIIAEHPDHDTRDADYRRRLYTEYARFVSELGGCYITAEDAGTGPSDMAVVARNTRFSTCVPPSVGGSGNPSRATAEGVVCGMEAAIAYRGDGELAGKTVAMQGAGNVAGFMIDALLRKRIGKVIATDISESRLAELRSKHAGEPVELRLAGRGDDQILAEACDVVAPNALGGVLNPDTIPKIQAPIVCGAANNQLLDSDRDGDALRERGIVYVPDYVCNRMGIVNCANEQYGQVPDDPAITRHFDREWNNSVFQVTQRVLRRADEAGTNTATAAHALADAAARQEHPIWGHRGATIIEALVRGGWADAEA